MNKTIIILVVIALVVTLIFIVFSPSKEVRAPTEEDMINNNSNEVTNSGTDLDGMTEDTGTVNIETNNSESVTNEIPQSEIAIRVNGEVVSKTTYNELFNRRVNDWSMGDPSSLTDEQLKEATRKAREESLDFFINQALIKHFIKTSNIIVTEEEINSQISFMEKRLRLYVEQYGDTFASDDLEELLESKDKEEARIQIREDLVVRKAIGLEKLAVTEDEIRNQYNLLVEDFGGEEMAEQWGLSSYEYARESILEEMEREKYNTQYLIFVAHLKDQAKIEIFV